MTTTWLLISVGALAALWALPGSVSAQQTPPFFSPGVAYAPEIGVVETGTLLDAQASVSADRKYVNLNMRPQVSTVVRIDTHAWGGSTQLAPGLVGFAPPPRPGQTPAPAARSPRTLQPQPAPEGNILDRPGITRLGDG
jgi:hypothetical protein